MSLRDPNVVNPTKRKRGAIVIANPAVSTTTGWPVGFWWSELTHSYYVFDSATDLISMGFISTPKLVALVENTKKVSEARADQFDAIVVAGGQAPMFTFEDAHDLQKKFVDFYASGKVAAALCHGVANAEDFADDAAYELNLLSRDKHIMPWRIEDELKRLGANYVQAGSRACSPCIAR